jgi:hypothetical protein
MPELSVLASGATAYEAGSHPACARPISRQLIACDPQTRERVHQSRSMCFALLLVDRW